MRTVVKKGFKLIATHVMSMAITLFLVFVFSWVIGKWGFLPFSVITALFYISMFYSEGWNWGRREGRKYNVIKENPVRALVASVIPSIICVAFAVLTAVGVKPLALSVAIKIWYFPFIGFYNNSEALSVAEILKTGAVIPIVVTIGYYVGTKNFSVLEKIAFRKNKKKEQEKKAQMNK